MGGFQEDDALVEHLAALAERELTGRLLDSSPDLQSLVEMLELPPGVSKTVELCLRGDEKLLALLRNGEEAGALERSWFVVGLALFVAGNRAGSHELAARGLELLLPDSFVPWVAKKYGIPADEVRRDLPAAAWSVVHAADESRKPVKYDRAYFAKGVLCALFSLRLPEGSAEVPIADLSWVMAEGADPSDLIAASEFAREIAQSDREMAYLMDLAIGGGQHGDAAEAARRHGISTSERRSLEARAATRRRNT